MATLKTAAAAPKRTTEKNFEAKWSRAIAAAGYTQVPDAIILHQARLGLAPLDVCILLVLLKYGHPGKPPWLGKTRIAEVLGIDSSTVRKRIAKMEARGFLKRKERKHGYGDSDTNLYLLDGLVEKLEVYANELVTKRQKRKEAETPQKPFVRPNLRMVPK